jgi:POT family proton-dependent oligopeptide transporter
MQVLAGIMHAFLGVYIWGQKYLTHVGNLEAQKVNEVDESSYGRLETFLNLKLNWYLIILSALSLFGWYNLGWAFGLLFLFLTVIVALMMIYKELSSQQIKIVLLFYCCLL